MNDNQAQLLAEQIEQQLMDRYGPIMGGRNLWQSLGYLSSEAFRQALSRETVPVPIFAIANRRGKFALTKDVAVWLVNQRAKAVHRKSKK